MRLNLKRRTLIYGVGINDSQYKTQGVDVQTCPFYARWRGMLSRCYSEEMLKRRPTYRGTIVCKEWHTFSNFKSWMEEQDWEGNHLDKDIISESKVYSPETCIFIPRKVNSFVVSAQKIRGDYLVGVSVWKERPELYVACCNNPFTGKRDKLGRYSDELTAHKVWKSKKVEHLRVLACEYNLTEDIVKGILRIIDSHELNYQPH